MYLILGVFLLSFFFFEKYGPEIVTIFYEYTLGKFDEEGVNYGSYVDRTQTTKQAWELAEKNPLLGISRMKPGSDLYVTSSLAEMVYQLGLPYLVLYVFLFWQVFRKMFWLFSIPFVLIMLNGEAYSFFILNIILVVVGSKIWHQKKYENINNYSLLQRS